MEHRSFPKAPGLAISTLAFGCVRLPMLGGERRRIDEERAARLLREAIDAGVNYVDTAWAHHAGEGEPFVGRALSGAWRARVQLATKAPASIVKDAGDWERRLDAQLERLGTDHVDFYLLQGLGREGWERALRLGGLCALDRAKADGRVAHLGVSFDGAPGELDAILAAYDWDCCEVELNFLDEARQCGREGLRRAAARGVGVIVAEPLRGGALARPPPVVQEAWAGAGARRSPAEWALRWAWGHAEVVTAVVAMPSEDDLREALRAAAGAGPVGDEERAAVERVRQVYRTRKRVPCTACLECQPCPSEVAVADVLSLYNDAMFDAKGPAAAAYARLVDAGHAADVCNACGECEARCPERIAIAEKLGDAHAYLTA